MTKGKVAVIATVTVLAWNFAAQKSSFVRNIWTKY